MEFQEGDGDGTTSRFVVLQRDAHKKLHMVQMCWASELDGGPSDLWVTIHPLPLHDGAGKAPKDVPAQQHLLAKDGAASTTGARGRRWRWKTCRFGSRIRNMNSCRQSQRPRAELLVRPPVARLADIRDSAEGSDGAIQFYHFRPVPSSLAWLSVSRQCRLHSYHHRHQHLCRPLRINSWPKASFGRPPSLYLFPRGKCLRWLILEHSLLFSFSFFLFSLGEVVLGLSYRQSVRSITWSFIS